MHIDNSYCFPEVFCTCTNIFVIIVVYIGTENVRQKDQYLKIKKAYIAKKGHFQRGK